MLYNFVFITVLVSRSCWCALTGHQMSPVCWAHGLLFVVGAMCSPVYCPLPSCYPIIVSVAPPVSPSLPSFVSLYSLLVKVVLCWSIVFCCVRVILTVQTCFACFWPSGWFSFIFVFILLLKTQFSWIWVLTISLLTLTDTWYIKPL